MGTLTATRSLWTAGIAVLLCGLAVPRVVRADIQSREVEYKQAGTVLQGFLAWDDDEHQKRPGVLIVHEWWGHNQHARNQALRLARAGYVAFALDMYGKGKVTTHPEDAKTFAAEASQDPVREQARFHAALAELKKVPQVDATKIAAIGYCFGGGVVLDMARLGEKLSAFATFHGSLASKLHPKKGIKPRILVMTGAEDPFNPPDQVAAFKKEMTDAGAQLEVISYPGVKHSFTNPDAGKAGMAALAYDATADQESFHALLRLFSQVFGRALGDKAPSK